MTGQALLATALSNPDCGGILINSALDEISVVIDRETAEYLLHAQETRYDRRGEAAKRRAVECLPVPALAA